MADPLSPAVQVTDVRALRALAHPLRNRLLGLLRLDGPSTATLLGQRVGESSGSTSYHLRQLAAYGFVEEVEEQGNGRDRWWRARHRMTGWDHADLVAQPGGAEVRDELLRLQMRLRAQTISAWARSTDELGPTWGDAASLNDYALRLTPEQARQLAAELHAVAAQWVTDHPPTEPAEGTELVALLLDVVPLREWPA